MRMRKIVHFYYLHTNASSIEHLLPDFDACQAVLRKKVISAFTWLLMCLTM